MPNDDPQAAAWEYELFYYGNANWPSDSTWRHNGSTYEALVELDPVADEADARVLWSYYDNRGWHTPMLHEYTRSGLRYLGAWVTATQEEYGQSKRGAWARPDGSYSYDFTGEKWTEL